MVRCKQCGYYQVAFGTTCLSLTPNQFTGYKNLIEDYYTMYKDDECENTKCIHIPTPVKALTQLYTLKELARLIALLEHAEATIAVEKLMA